MRKSFKALLELGRPFAGCFVQLPSPEIVEIMGEAGYDFIIVDNEHTGIEPEGAVGLVRAAEAVDTCVLIRTADATETRIKKALDTGAAGILVPGITGAEMARQVVYYGKYAPEGLRGSCPGVRANYYGRDGVSFYSCANRDTALTIQIEGEGALREFDEIIAVEGIDAVLLGPVDLSMALGVPGEVDHPKVVEAMKHMVKRAGERGVKCATFCMDAQSAGMWLSQGMDFLAYHIDAMLIRGAAKAAVEEIQALMKR